jgi:hypothetical protein
MALEALVLAIFYSLDLTQRPHIRSTHVPVEEPSTAS